MSEKTDSKNSKSKRRRRRRRRRKRGGGGGGRQDTGTVVYGDDNQVAAKASKRKSGRRAVDLTGPVVSVMSGIQEDAEGRMWMNYWTYSDGNPAPGLTYVDSETMAVGPAFPIGCDPSSCRGMSIDLDGNVWSTAQSMDTAFRFNPDTMQVDTYDQLSHPYTYSDMTGWAVQNAGCGPEG